jgi:hypothetical protein
MFLSMSAACSQQGSLHTRAMYRTTSRSKCLPVVLCCICRASLSTLCGHVSLALHISSHCPPLRCAFGTLSAAIELEGLAASARIATVASRTSVLPALAQVRARQQTQLLHSVRPMRCRPSALLSPKDSQRFGAHVYRPSRHAQTFCLEPEELSVKFDSWLLAVMAGREVLRRAMSAAVPLPCLRDLVWTPGGVRAYSAWAGQQASCPRSFRPDAALWPSPLWEPGSFARTMTYAPFKRVRLSLLAMYPGFRHTTSVWQHN